LNQELTAPLNTAGFTLRKWASNHPSFLDSIPTELKETNQTLSLANDNGVTTLGLLWAPTADQLQVKNNIQIPTYKLHSKHKTNGASHISLHF
jgi:hypothetical protein